MKVLLFIALSLTLQSCGGISKTKLSNGGKEVRELKSGKTPGCSVVDKVVGMNEKGSEDLAQNHVRNLGADLEGNAFFINETVQNGSTVKVYATIYQCE